MLLVVVCLSIRTSVVKMFTGPSDIGLGFVCSRRFTEIKKNCLHPLAYSVVLQKLLPEESIFLISLIVGQFTFQMCAAAEKLKKH